MTDPIENKDAEIFSKRRPRTMACRMCGGRGRVERRYALVPSLFAIEDAPKDAILAFVVGSSDIFECTREALEIATSQRRPVAFDFNERTVLVNPGDDADQVARAWWRATYDETPEQTRARR